MIKFATKLKSIDLNLIETSFKSWVGVKEFKIVAVVKETVYGCQLPFNVCSVAVTQYHI